jgi:hypothetical protein
LENPSKGTGLGGIFLFTPPVLKHNTKQNKYQAKDKKGSEYYFVVLGQPIWEKNIKIIFLGIGVISC